LRDEGYPRLYYQGSTGDLFEYRSANPDAIPGFSTQIKSRTQILSKLEELLRNSVVKSYSQRLYNQLQAFVWTGSRAQASKDAHDDLIMSLAICTWLVAGDSSGRSQGSEMAWAMLKATKLHQNKSMPGDIESAKPFVTPSLKGQMLNPKDVHKPKDPTQIKHTDVSDFSWLYR
jgi:hypothetical protein